MNRLLAYVDARSGRGADACIERDLSEFVHDAQIKKPAKTASNPKGAGRADDDDAPVTPICVGDADALLVRLRAAHGEARYDIAVELVKRRVVVER